ncbi:unnamed protein product [Sphenostylis stenocarpa]|uniref:C3H1-type domain-containing protein n=1 Tax=Sphenostylis stenocarpa TaxID=92480 RepID=A0AA86S741_9FABA|nr:unnamed protein product [Sphenostylis stenocarpa]
MECYGDILTPDIPLIPVEEQASVEDKHDDTVTKYAENELQTQLLQQYIPLARSSSEVDLFAAYATVAAAIMKRNEEQCLIDTNFLLETVNDPIKIGNLIQEYISTTSTFNTATPTRTVSIPTSCYAPATSSVPLTTPASKTTPFVSLLSPTPEKSTIPSVSLEVTTLDKPVATAPLTKPASTETETTNTVTKRVEKPEAPLQNQRQEHLESDASSVSSQRCVKDVNYYMNLVNDPDDNKKDMRSRNNFRDSKQSRNNTTNPEEEKFKIHKPCKYFKTSRGCRNGSNCRYEHERSVWRM